MTLPSTPNCWAAPRSVVRIRERRRVPLSPEGIGLWKQRPKHAQLAEPGRREGEDLGWLVRGIRYLGRVDAKTPDSRSRLDALRLRVTARIKKDSGRRPGD